jgi:hypothetical protein
VSSEDGFERVTRCAAHLPEVEAGNTDRAAFVAVDEACNAVGFTETERVIFFRRPI